MHAPATSLATCLSLVCFAPTLTAQVEHPGEALGSLLPVLEGAALVDGPDVPAALAEDAARGPYPLMYGRPMPTSIDVRTHGQWDTAPDGTLVWRLAIASPGAFSLGLEFSAYDMPRGATLFAYDRAMEHVYGAFTDQNENPDGEFTLRPLPGDELVLELQLPADVDELPQLAIDHVIHDYRDVFRLMETEAGEGGGEGSCFVNVNCPEGDPYGLLKRSAVKTFSGGGLCSGAMVNNTANDGTRYLLTAQHCGQSSNVVVTYNYQTENCVGGLAPQNQTVQGATFLASDAASDGRLMRLNNAIPAGYNVYYKGWSRSTTNPTQGVSMHHPNGGVKKLSIDSNGGGKATVNFVGIGAVKCWAMNFNVGGTDGGSSGGPLQDQNGRIRGVLTGGNGCTQKYYGRFYEFWNATNIAQYLDPLGTGATNLDGFDPSGGGGGGPEPPEITGITPGSILAVNPAGPPSLTIDGLNFSEITEVKVNGVALSTFPPAWSVVSDTQITFTPDQSTTLGVQTVEVVGADGSDTGQYSVNVNLGAPTLDLLNSDPGFLLTTLGIEALVGSLPGDLVFLLASGSPVPSVLPGIVSLDLGNNFLELVQFPTKTVDGVKGYAEWGIPLNPSLPTGTKIYVQAAVLDVLFLSLPLTETNLEVGTILF